MPQANLSKLDHWCFKGLGTLIEMVRRRSLLAPIANEQFRELVEAYNNFGKILETASRSAVSPEIMELGEYDKWILLGLTGMVKIILTRIQINDDLSGLDDAFKEQANILRSLLSEDGNSSDLQD